MNFLVRNKRGFGELYTEEDLLKKSCLKLSARIVSGYFYIDTDIRREFPEYHILRFLETNCNLRKIHISASNNLKDTCVSYLMSIQKNDSVHSLRLSNLLYLSENLIDRISTLIFNNPTIRSLEIGTATFTQLTFFNFCTGLSSDNHIQRLSIRSLSNTNFFKNFSCVLTNNTTLVSLTIADSGFNEDSRDFIKALTINTTITSLTLSNNLHIDPFYVHLLDCLSSHKSITSLDLSGSIFTHRAAGSVPKLLTTNTTLRSLNLNNCSLNYTLVDPIFDALKLNTTLTCLNFEKNCTTSAINSSSFEECITTNTTLTALNMKGNYISKERIAGLAIAFSLNSTLTDLNFSKTMQFVCEGPVLHKAILSNPSLKFLSFKAMTAKNVIEEIGNQLKTNTTLLSLNIAGNNMRPTPSCLLETLKTNTTLTDLDISSDHHTNYSIDLICSLIRENNTLKSLNIFYSHWLTASMKKINDALSQNTSLISFNAFDDFYAKCNHTTSITVRKNLTLYELLIHLIL